MGRASQIVRQLRQSIEANGQASLVVSGGSSPLALFHDLAAGQHDGAIDWSRVTITLVDDRQVPASHEHSNQKLIHEHLMQGPVAKATFLPLTPDGAVNHLPRPFDVMVLGMGLDGHFASLFPDMVASPALQPDASPAIIETGPQGSPKLPRISMNLAMILQSRLIVLLVTGKDKKAVLETARTDMGLPVHALLTQTIAPIEIADE